MDVKNKRAIVMNTHKEAQEEIYDKIVLWFTDNDNNEIFDTITLNDDIPVEIYKKLQKAAGLERYTGIVFSGELDDGHIVKFTDVTVVTRAEMRKELCRGCTLDCSKYCDNPDFTIPIKADYRPRKK